MHGGILSILWLRPRHGEKEATGVHSGKMRISHSFM